VTCTFFLSDVRSPPFFLFHGTMAILLDLSPFFLLLRGVLRDVFSLFRGLSPLYVRAFFFIITPQGYGLSLARRASLVAFPFCLKVFLLLFCDPFFFFGIFFRVLASLSDHFFFCRMPSSLVRDLFFSEVDGLSRVHLFSAAASLLSFCMLIFSPFTLFCPTSLDLFSQNPFFFSVTSRRSPFGTIFFLFQFSLFVFLPCSGEFFSFLSRPFFFLLDFFSLSHPPLFSSFSMEPLPTLILLPFVLYPPFLPIWSFSNSLFFGRIFFLLYAHFLFFSIRALLSHPLLPPIVALPFS